MLQICISTDRKANTQEMLGQITRAAGQGIGGQFLLVPEQFSHMTERRLCAHGGSSISRFVEVLGFSRLANRVFAAEGGIAQEETDAGGRLMMMALAVEQVQSKLKIYSTAAAKPEFLQQLLDTLEELRGERITPERLKLASTALQGALAQKTQELSLLMESYSAVCAQAGQNPETRLNRLLSALELGNFARGKRFYLDGFTDFNGVELAILSQLLDDGAEVTVNLTCDDPVEGAQQYALARETIGKLLACGKACRLVTVQPRPRPMDGVREAVFAGGAQKAAPARFRLAPDSYTECRAAIGELLSLVKGGARWREISVACPRDYLPILRSELRRAGIPAYFAGDTPILQQPVVHMLLTALEAAVGGMERETVISYLKSGLSPLSDAAVDRMEDYALLWDISGSGWDREWSMNPQGLKQSDDPEMQTRLQELNRDRQIAIVPLLRLRSRLRRAADTGQMVVAFYDFTQEIGLDQRLNALASRMEADGKPQKAQEYVQVYGILVGLLEQMFGVLGRTVRSAEDFHRMLRVALNQYQVGTIPATLDCVSVGDLMAQRRCDGGHLLILGANEGGFPSLQPNLSLLTDQERKYLTAVGIDIVPLNQRGLERELAAIDSVLAAPEQSLWISAIAGKESYLFARGAEAFPPETVDETAWIRGCPSAYLEYLTALPETRGQTPQEQQADRLRSARDYRLEPLPKETVRALYGDKLRLSSSKIDQLAQCRFAYFLQYGLKAEEQKPAELDAMTYGTFVHYVLEHTARRTMQEGGFHAVPPERVLDFAEEYMQQYVQQELYELLKDERSAYLLRRTFREIRQVVLELQRELSQCDFEPKWFELHFAQGQAIPAVEIVGQEATAQLSGVVDRADIWRDGDRTYVRIVDYKTGKKNFDYHAVLNGLSLQMLLYLFTLQKCGLEGRELLPAGVLYFPARVERVNISDRTDTAEIEKERRAAQTRKGLLLNSRQVLDAMGDRQFLPYTLDKEGNPKGDLAAMEELALLQRHVNRTVQQLADSLYRGEISPNPYYRDTEHNGCRWCPFGEVCRSSGHWRQCRPEKTAADFWKYLREAEHDGNQTDERTKRSGQ